MSHATLDRRYFARDEDGNIKTKTPCSTPGCDVPNWHLCQGPTVKPARTSRNGSLNFMEKFEMEPGARERIVEAQRAKNAEREALANEINRERDEMVIRDHVSGHSKTWIMSKYGLTSHYLNKILARIDEFIF